MDDEKKVQMGEIQPHYNLRSRTPSKRKIQSSSSSPNDFRNTKRPAPAEEKQIRLLNKKIKDLEDELLRVKQELHQANSRLEKMDECQQEVEKQTDVHNIFLREEIVRNIFKFLNYKELCRSARVCKDWHRISRHQDFSKKIFVNWKTPEAVLQCIEELPSCTTHIVQAGVSDNTEKLCINLDKFVMKIQQRCPNLHTLILNRIAFDVYGEIFNLFIQLPETVEVFVLHDCDICGREQNYVNSDQISMIRVLNLSTCNQVFIRPFSFSNMPFLKHLRLTGCVMARSYISLEHFPVSFRQDYFFESIVKVLCQQLTILDLELAGIGSTTFRTIFSSCSQLEELYVCFSCVKDSDLTFIANRKIVLTSLKKICLRNCLVRSVGINALIQAIPSLSDVYVGSKDSIRANHYSDCLSGKVHVINDLKHCKHHKNVNFLTV